MPTNLRMLEMLDQYSTIVEQIDEWNKEKQVSLRTLKVHVIASEVRGYARNVLRASPDDLALMSLSDVFQWIEDNQNRQRMGNADIDKYRWNMHQILCGTFYIEGEGLNVERMLLGDTSVCSSLCIAHNMAITALGQEIHRLNKELEKYERITR